MAVSVMAFPSSLKAIYVQAGGATSRDRRRNAGNTTPTGVIIMDYAALRSLPDMFFQQADRLGDRPFLWAKRGGEWRPMRWAEEIGGASCRERVCKYV